MTAQTKLFVCISCRRPLSGTEQNGAEPAYELPGPALAAHLHGLLQDDRSIEVVEIECLAVCKRPCTVALAADGKWTYVIGDLELAAHGTEIADAARAFTKSDNGIVPWKERPASFRKGVISRIPPTTFEPVEQSA
jgi:predicted metal-binding protein